MRPAHKPGINSEKVEQKLNKNQITYIFCVFYYNLVKNKQKLFSPICYCYIWKLYYVKKWKAGNVCS